VVGGGGGHMELTSENCRSNYPLVSHPWCDRFYRLLHSYTRHIEGVKGGERDIVLVHKNEAMVAWPEAIACHKPRRQSGVIKAHPRPLS
jgi:hypothetical protein